MEKKTCFLLLGSNRGDSLRLLGQARVAIAERAGAILDSSRIYRTAPWGFDSADDFYNQVIRIETLLSPEELLVRLLDIEKALGRMREPNPAGYASRTMDIDVLFIGERVISTRDLTLPHPRLHLRRFTLAPLAELDPEFVHPVLKKTLFELYRDCEDHLPAVAVREGRENHCR